jgi:hypothetical protein
MRNKRNKPNSPADRLLSFDTANLAAAKLILADRSRYDRPDSRGVITWAEAVLRRLEPHRIAGLPKTA